MFYLSAYCCVCVCVCQCVYVCTLLTHVLETINGGQRASERNQYSLPGIWFSGIELRLSRLVADAFNNGAGLGACF